MSILPNLYGNINEDSCDHLQDFSKICGTAKYVDDYVDGSFPIFIERRS